LTSRQRGEYNAGNYKLLTKTMKSKKTKKKVVAKYRSAKSGRYTTKAVAKRRPSSTVKESK